MAIQNIRFGVEIEFTGIPRSKASEIIAEYFDSTSEHVGGGYDKYSVLSSDGRNWTVMSDASLLAEKKQGKSIVGASDIFRCELVTPICTYSDIIQLQEIIRLLRGSNALVNSSTGIHIHIDGALFTPRSLRNILNIINSKQELIVEAFNISNNRQRYCKKLEPDLVNRMNGKKLIEVKQLEDAWYGSNTESRSIHYNSTRYHLINLHSYFSKGTVELRFFNSSMHAGEIKAYIQFSLAIANQALTQKTASAKPTITDNPKYAFRCWLLRLGLIGDEFKTCRYHLLKHLTGNSAWRHGSQIPA